MHYCSEFIINMIGSKTVSGDPNVSTLGKKAEFLSNEETEFVSAFLNLYSKNIATFFLIDIWEMLSS